MVKYWFHTMFHGNFYISLYNEIVVTKIVMMSYIILYEAPFDIAWLLSGVMYSCCYVIQLIHSKDLKRMAPQNIGPLMNDTADNYQLSYTYNVLIHVQSTMGGHACRLAVYCRRVDSFGFKS